MIILLLKIIGIVFLIALIALVLSFFEEDDY